jgi:hypothetical protein
MIFEIKCHDESIQDYTFSLYGSRYTILYPEIQDYYTIKNSYIRYEDDISFNNDEYVLDLCFCETNPIHILTVYLLNVDIVKFIKEIRLELDGKCLDDINEYLSVEFLKNVVTRIILTFYGITRTIKQENFK